MTPRRSRSHIDGVAWTLSSLAVLSAQRSPGAGARPRDLVLGDEGSRRIDVAIETDPKDREPAVGKLLVQALECGHLVDARRADSRPEVDEYDGAAQIRESQAPAVEKFDREVWEDGSDAGVLLDLGDESAVAGMRMQCVERLVLRKGERAGSRAR